MIRRAKKEDLAELLQLYTYLLPGDTSVSREEYGKNWDYILSYPDFFRYFVAENAGRLVAGCCIAIIPNLTRGCSPYGIIENVITHPGFRRQGYGRKVMTRAIDYARERGCYKVMLLSRASRVESHGFYKSLGFDPTSKKGFHLRLKPESPESDPIRCEGKEG